MQSQYARRKLLKLAATLPVSLPVFNVIAGEDVHSLSYHLVKNQVTGAGIQEGALVLVDSFTRGFSGDGFYLYPDWGNPVVYEVRSQGNSLVFYYPGLGDPLWEMAAAHDGVRFSGRVEGVVNFQPADAPGMLAQANLRVLEVPALPGI